MFNTAKRIALSTILAIALAGIAAGPAVADTAFVAGPRSRFASWTFSPNSPSCVYPADGYLALSGATVVFTTPPLGSGSPWSWWVSAELDVLFASGQSGQPASCIANLSLSPPVTSGGSGAPGYATPNNSVGAQSAHAVLNEIPLVPATTYTITPQIAAAGSYHCNLIGNAAVHVVLLSNM
jgi:hypothetical protein